MNKLFAWLFVLLFSYIACFSQKGHVYIKNYHLPFEHIDYENHDALQGQDNMLYFANKRGVIFFDGVDWDIINTSGTPYSLHIAANSNKIFVGCNQGFGYITENEFGKEIYHSLSDSIANPGMISEIVSIADTVYFYSTHKLYRYVSNTGIINELTLADETEFAGIVQFSKNIYINAKTKGLYKLENGIFRYLPKTLSLGEHVIITSTEFSKKHTLLGTNNNDLILFDGKQVQKFKHEAEDYVNSNLLSSSLRLDNGNIVIGTLSGGCLVLNRQGTQQQILNFQTGLPDDEIFSMCTDNQEGLWICNEYCISRADFGIPIESYNFSGLEGNLISSVHHNDTLYVATNEGLFYLGKATRLSDITDYIKKEHKKDTITNVYQKWITIRKTLELTFTPEMRDTSENPPDPVVQKIPVSFKVPVDSVATVTKDVFTSERIRQIYARQSIDYVYRKIPGIDEKCNHIIPYDDKLLIATNIGLFELDRLKVTPVIKEQYINYILHSDLSNHKFYVGTNRGLYTIEYTDNGWNKEPYIIFDEPVHSITQHKEFIWAGGQNKVFKLNTQKRGRPFEVYDIPNDFAENIIVQQTDIGLLCFSSSGLYTYDKHENKLIKYHDLFKQTNTGLDIIAHQSGYTWVSENNNWKSIGVERNLNPVKYNYLRLFKNIKNIYVDNNENIWLINDNEVYKLLNEVISYDEKDYKLEIQEILDKGRNYLPLESFGLDYNNNALTIQLAAQYYISEQSTEYQYNLGGLDNTWSSWIDDHEIVFNFLPSGQYHLKVRAKNILGHLSETASIKFKVKAPFWQRWWFYVLVIAALIILGYLVIRIRTQALEKAKKRLEQEVNKATKEIREQKAQLEVAYGEIEEKNRDITDSINYAERIQEASLPFKETLKSIFQEYLLLYRPRDIVSGDFYWVHEEDDKLIVIVADCTGHGVPGAFMSLIGNSLLNQIVREQKIHKPSEILETLDQEIINALKQDQEDPKSSDGMDITVCTLHKHGKKIEFAGANNAAYLVINDKMVKIPAEPIGIGGVHPKIKVKKFKNHVLDIQGEVCVYMLSDGYIDQNGGDKDKKFMSGRFRRMLNQIHSKPFYKQKQILEETLDNWKGDKEQRDDIIVLGFKYTL